MAVLSVRNLAKYWGADVLFRNVSFLVNEGEKVALVGRNGTGKTTLLRIIAGLLGYDEGAVSLAKGCRAGYLTQDPEFSLGPDATLSAEAQSVLAHLDDWEVELRSLEEKMARVEREDELTSIMERYGRLAEKFEMAGGYDAPARVKAILFGLGFGEEDLEKPVKVLSGGQKVRLGLAKILLEEPDLMLMDEPTNHLDLAATEWLEEYLRSLRVAALIVSHDRYFLDRVTTQTLELAHETAELYAGSYSFYVQEKQRRLEAARDAYERQQREIARIQFFIDKFRAGTRATMAKSREKALARMERLERPPAEEKTMGLRFNMEFDTGREVLKTKNLTKAYDKLLFSGVGLRLYKGERVALVGPNGAGKTTLIKILHGLERPTAGSFMWGVGVRRGYFSQDLDSLNYQNTCLQEIMDLPGFTRFEAQSLLGRFLFSGEEVQKPIAACSGGERNRLSLAKLMVTGANVLLLDEPTNHLDLESKQVLEEALVEFPGTVIFVSHDRYFVDRVATKIWEFAEDGSGQVREYQGNYSAYRAQKEREREQAQQQAQERQPVQQRQPAQGRGQGQDPVQGQAQAQAKVKVKSQTRTQPRGREEAPGQHRLSPQARRKAAEALRLLEATIENLERRQADLEALLADPQTYKSAASAGDDDTARQLVAEYEAVNAKLKALYVEWECQEQALQSGE